MENCYTGRRKITIPVSKEKFDENPLKYVDHYLTNCLSINEKNYNECQRLKNIYKGKQSIFQKTRLNNDTINNNKVVVNHHFRQVEFKKGFTVGNPIDYSLSSDTTNSDELSYLKKYFKDQCKAEKDIDKYEDLYTCGMAVQFIVPRKTDFDVENEAPYELYNVDLGSGFVVYSNDVSKTPLFNVYIDQEIDDKWNTVKVYSVYLINPSDNYCYLFKYNSDKKRVPFSVKGIKFEADKGKKQPYKFLPLVEYSLNKNRVGVVELVISIGEALNVLQSNQMDDVVDFVNAYIVFENVDPVYILENIDKFKEKRTLAVKTTTPQSPAKVNILKQTLSHTEINSFFEIMLREMYDIPAVPQTSGNVTSGGDTGEARILGNGWESAQNQAKVDTLYVSQYERELLRKIIIVCKEKDTCPINDLSVNDIEIKYAINMSNNILTKTQALQNLDTMGMPKEESLQIVGITSDTHGLAEKWQESVDKAAEKEAEKETQNNNNDNNNVNIEE